MFFIKNLRLGIWLSILLGVLSPIDHWLLVQASPWANLTWWGGGALSLLLLYLAGGFGLNLSTGSLRRQQSQGAVDNGAACAILLGLAERIQRGELPLRQTRVTLALFTGEEINMQGARAYALSRQWPLPTIALNLEVMAQNGEYVFWEQDGNSFRLFPTSAEVNQRLVKAVQAVTGSPPQPAGPINSDGFRFLQAGVPAGVLGTYDAVLKDRGFHGPADNLGRVAMERLPEGVEILATFIKQYDDKEDS
jgi:Zn-dependent M28 family amino/carboxypeptidase